MSKIVAAVVLSPIAGLFLLGSAFAQDAAAGAGEMTIGDQVIPQEQQAAVEDWCKELQAQQGLTGTQEPESTMSEEQVEAVAPDQATEGENSFDITTVTLEMCQEAGLTNQEGD